jgi:hypothetical protein
MAPPGEREQPVFLRSWKCGRERTDVDFHEQFGA